MSIHVTDELVCKAEALANITSDPGSITTVLKDAACVTIEFVTQYGETPLEAFMVVYHLFMCVLELTDACRQQWLCVFREPHPTIHIPWCWRLRRRFRWRWRWLGVPDWFWRTWTIC